MQRIEGIPVWGEPQPDAIRQMKTCAATAEGVALMADHHVGYSMPIGGVAAYKDMLSPSGVGYDIACGNKAVLLDLPASEVRARISTIMDDIYRSISFGQGHKNRYRVDHDLFDDPAWSLPAVAALRERAQSQLGTVGSGNHYVDLFTDGQDRVWLGVHFGSRGFGHGVASHFMKAGGGKDGMFNDPVLVKLGTSLGDDYLTAMQLAGRYAYAGRDWVCDHVAGILGASQLESVHNHHNYAWKETHNGDDVWVVRKGATPSFPGQKGFVGGSMGDISVILEGVESDEAKEALYSTVHGAGRVMSRTRAAGKWNKTTRQYEGGQVTPQMMREWLDRENVELRGGGLDESPHAYKRLPEVLDHHAPTVRILHTLTPIGVAMASSHEFDPYKD